MKLYLLQIEAEIWGYQATMPDFIWFNEGKNLVSEKEVKNETGRTIMEFLKTYAPYKGLFKRLLKGGKYQLTKEEFDIINKLKLYYTKEEEERTVIGKKECLVQMLEQLEKPTFEYASKCLYGNARRFVELEYVE